MKLGTTRGLWLLVLLIGCERKAAESPQASSPAARVSGHAKESELSTLTLTGEAEQRLGIRVAPVVLRPMPRIRLRGGRVVVPPGRALAVQAPVAGTLLAKEPEAATPHPGEPVARGTVLFLLAPLFSPEARASIATQLATAEGDARQAEAELAAAREALRRAEALLAARAGSQRGVDETRAARDGAEARLAAARQREQALARAAAGELDPIAIAAPLDGILCGIHAGPGQVVPASAALFEVANTSRVWVRVPVYVGEAEQVKGGAPARAEGLELRPIAAPPSADPAGATLDLYYEVENPEGRLRPDQSVLVELALASSSEERTIASSAVLHDVHGGTWVYVRIADATYSRQRVLVDRVVSGEAVLARGPEPGTEVVIEGAAELFGTEFFVSK